MSFSTVKCFRWRVARQCETRQSQVRCSLKHRPNLDVILETNHEQSVTFTSPGFHRQNTTEPKGAYYNRNFCIFNISLSCQEELVELKPSERTNSLSDADTCRDYLSFHATSTPYPNFKLCGREIMDTTKYQIIPSSTFYGVLWTNDNQNEWGRFEIEASCKESTESSTNPEILSSRDSGRLNSSNLASLPDNQKH